MPGCYEDLEEADLVVLVGSNMAWCHPVLYQRLMAARETARHEDRRDRSAPHRHRRSRRPASAARRRARTSLLFNGLLAPIWPMTGALDRDWIARTRPGFERCARCGAAIARPRSSWSPRRRTLTPESLRAFYDLFARTERVVTVYSQGVNQSVSRHRQGQRHHQLPSRDRTHRPPRHGAVLADRTAQCDGRA